jgi:hypothetical protein
MRKKGANLCPQNCDPLDEDNDFTLRGESQLSYFLISLPIATALVRVAAGSTVSLSE